MKLKTNDIVWARINQSSYWPAQVCNPEQACEEARCKQLNGQWLLALYGTHKVRSPDTSLLGGRFITSLMLCTLRGLPDIGLSSTQKLLRPFLRSGAGFRPLGLCHLMRAGLT
jgi:hypothetical protein